MFFRIKLVNECEVEKLHHHIFLIHNISGLKINHIMDFA
jgi:hypothetical protein